MRVYLRSPSAPLTGAGDDGFLPGASPPSPHNSVRAPTAPRRRPARRVAVGRTGIASHRLARYVVAFPQSSVAQAPGQDPSADADRALVSRIRAGDEGAFEQLYARFASSLLGFAYSQLRRRETAEEIVQELFLAVWRHRANWELTRSLKSYLFGALRHHIVSYRRTLRARDEQLQSSESADEDLAALPSALTADDLARESELIEAINRAVAGLSPRCRETFLLVRQQHLSYAEAAEVLGISTKAVEMNMVRSFAALRRQLAPWRE